MLTPLALRNVTLPGVTAAGLDVLLLGFEDPVLLFGLEDPEFPPVLSFGLEGFWVGFGVAVGFGVGVTVGFGGSLMVKFIVVHAPSSVHHL